MMGGGAGEGKDTTAKVLIEQYGFKRLAFADPLKRVALPLLRDLCGVREATAAWFEGANKDEPLGISILGLSAAESTPRALLKWFGTKVMRNMAFRDIWVRAFLNDVKTEVQAACLDGRPLRVVVTDLRFINEVSDKMRERLRRLGFHTIRAWRVRNPNKPTPPDLSAVTESERGTYLISFDEIIDNVRATTPDSIRTVIHRLHGQVHDRMRPFGLMPSYPMRAVTRAVLEVVRSHIPSDEVDADEEQMQILTRE